MNAGCRWWREVDSRGASPACGALFGYSAEPFITYNFLSVQILIHTQPRALRCRVSQKCLLGVFGIPDQSQFGFFR